MIDKYRYWFSYLWLILKHIPFSDFSLHKHNIQKYEIKHYWISYTYSNTCLNKHLYMSLGDFWVVYFTIVHVINSINYIQENLYITDTQGTEDICPL